jgi:hypothetical protein
MIEAGYPLASPSAFGWPGSTSSHPFSTEEAAGPATATIAGFNCFLNDVRNQPRRPDAQRRCQITQAIRRAAAQNHR